MLGIVKGRPQLVLKGLVAPQGRSTQSSRSAASCKLLGGNAAHLLRAVLVHLPPVSCHQPAITLPPVQLPPLSNSLLIAVHSMHCTPG